MRNYTIAAIIFVVLIAGFGLLISKATRKNDRVITPQPQTIAQPEKFIDKTSEVSLTADGAIVGFEAHKAIRITISPTNRTIELIKGYNGEVFMEQTFVNESPAFDEFLAALDTQGFSKENSEVSADEQGACPQGIRYIYEAKYKSGDHLRSWSATCGNVRRFQGNTPIVLHLFKNQIPNYDTIVRGVNLLKP